MRIKTSSAFEHKTSGGQHLFGRAMSSNAAMIVPGGTTSCFASCCSTCTCGVLSVVPAAK